MISKARRMKRIVVPEIMLVLAKYGVNGKVKSVNHNIVYVEIKAGKINFTLDKYGCTRVTEDEFLSTKNDPDCYTNEPELERRFLTELYDAMNARNTVLSIAEQYELDTYKNEDIKVEVRIGKWPVPYQLVA
ncbi:MAG: hypothetical protein ACJAS1_003682 [Oleiphilaceae bacterium]|jgi:hypothetical protein